MVTGNLLCLKICIHVRFHLNLHTRKLTQKSPFLHQKVVFFNTGVCVTKTMSWIWTKKDSRFVSLSLRLNIIYSTKWQLKRCGLWLFHVYFFRQNIITQNNTILSLPWTFVSNPLEIMVVIKKIKKHVAFFSESESIFIYCR